MQNFLSSIKSVSELNDLLQHCQFDNSSDFKQLIDKALQLNSDIVVRYGEFICPFFKNNSLDDDCLKYFIQHLKSEQLKVFSIQTDWIELFLSRKLKDSSMPYSFNTFREFVDLLKQENAFAFFLAYTQDLHLDSPLTLTLSDLSYVFSQINDYESFYSFLSNSSLFETFVKHNLIDKSSIQHLWKHVIDELKETKTEIQSPAEMLRDNFLKLLFKHKFLDSEDISYALHSFTTFLEIEDTLSYCRPFTFSYILSNFLIDPKLCEAFDSIVLSSHLKQTLFDFLLSRGLYPEVRYIQDHLKNCISLHTKFPDQNEFKAITQLIQANAQSKERLTQILNSNLEDNYTFESLLQYLRKHEKKNLLNI